MTDRITIACPHCQHELRVRPEYAGRKLECNYCRKTFEARFPGVADAPSAAGAGHAQGATSPETPRSTRRALAQELERAQAKITQLRGQRQALAEEVLKARNTLGPLRHRVKDLEDQLDQARVQQALAEEEVRASAPALAELDRLRMEIATLGPRAADAVRLEERVAVAGQENDRLRQELAELRGLLARGREVDDSSHAAEIARLESQRDEAARERDRLETELRSVGTGFREARDEINRMGRGLEEIAAERTRLEEERAAMSQMRDELQRLVDEQRRSLARRESELGLIQERLDLERAELESRLSDDGRRIAAELVDAQARSEETTRRLEAAAADSRRQLASAEREVTALRDSLAAAQQTIETHNRERNRLTSLHEQERQRADRAEERQGAETERLLGERSEALAQVEVKTRLIADLNRRLRSLQDEIAQASRTPASANGLPDRPQASEDEEPAVFRTRLQVWLEEAGEALAAATAQADMLGAEVKTARDELEVLNTDLALGAWDEDEEEIAFPFEEG